MKNHNVWSEGNTTINYQRLSAQIPYKQQSDTTHIKANLFNNLVYKQECKQEICNAVQTRCRKTDLCSLPHCIHSAQVLQQTVGFEIKKQENTERDHAIACLGIISVDFTWIYTFI